MKILFKLIEHKNDKNTGFAGSLHAGCVLAALALMESAADSEDVSQACVLSSRISFRRPVVSDYQVESAYKTPDTIESRISDAQGFKVRAQQAFQTEWASLLPESRWVPSDEPGEALPDILAHIQAHFPISRELAIEGLRVNAQGLTLLSGTRAFKDRDQRVLYSLVLAYLSAWSLGSSVAAEFGSNDVLVSRAHADIDLHGRFSPVAPQAVPLESDGLVTLRKALQQEGAGRVELVAQAYSVALKGMFHVRLKD